MHIVRKMVNFLDNTRKNSENFFYGYFYPVIFAFAVFLFWVANLQIFGFILISLTACFLFITDEDLTPIFPMLFMLGMSFRDTSIYTTSFYTYAILGLFAIGIVVNLIRFPVRKLKLDKILFTIILVFVSMLIGGIFSPFLYDYSVGFSIMAISGISAFAVYFFFSYRTKPNGRVNLKKYFCFTFLIAVNLACMQLLYSCLDVIIIQKKHIWDVNLGWANINHIGNLIVIAIPLCFYLMVNAKNIFPYILELVFLYCSVFASQSDGSIVLSLIALPILLTFTYYRISDKNFLTFKYFCIILLSLTAIIVTYILLFNTEIFIAFIKKSTDPNGRITAYEHAIKIFLEYPIFGVGVGHGMIAVNSCGNFYGLFHSTLFHTLATTGIVGLIAYVFYYIERLKLITKNRTTLGFYALVSFIAFAIYGIVDNSEFNIVLVYMTAIIAITGLENKKNDDQPLPLTHMRRNIFTINKKEK